MASCGADGKRFIGSSKNAPRGYLDCTRGPRIYIKRHEDGMIYSSDGSNIDLDDMSQSESPETEQIEGNGDVKPLSRAERAKLKKEFEALSNNQSDQITQSFLPLIEAIKRIEGGPSKSGSKYNEDLLKQLDPQSEKILKDVLGPNYKRRMHKFFHHSQRP
jgi:hypothetical protein